MVECALYGVPGAQITKFWRDEDDSNNGMVDHLNANDLTLYRNKILKVHVATSLFQNYIHMKREEKNTCPWI